MAELKQDYAQTAIKAFLFRGLTAKELTELLSDPDIRINQYPAGVCVRGHETPVRSLGIVLEGSLTVEKYCGGEHMLMSILQKGELFGAAAMFGSQEQYVADITARTTAATLEIPEETLKEILRGDFRITENYLRYLSGRIRFLTKRMDAFAQSSTEERVMLFFRNNAENGELTLDYSISALADALCIGRASLYRALEALEKKGQINRNGRTIQFNDSK